MKVELGTNRGRGAGVGDVKRGFSQHIPRHFAERLRVPQRIRRDLQHPAGASRVSYEPNGVLRAVLGCQVPHTTSSSKIPGFLTERAS